MFLEKNISKNRFSNSLKTICLIVGLSFGTHFVSKAVTPVVTGIYPATGEINGYFSLLGSNFQDVEFIYFKGDNGTVDFITGNSYSSYIEVNFPSNIRNGNLTLTGVFGSVITSFPFQLATPSITSIQPTVGTNSNGSVVLSGSNLRGIDRVYFTTSDGNEASVGSSANLGNELILYFIPSNAALGNFTLTGGFGKVVSNFNYSPAIPTVTGIYPAQGLVDGNLTLFGKNLDGVQSIKYKNTGGNIITDPVNASTNKIVHTPYLISTGAITLTGGFGTKISEFSFQTPMPTVTGIFPETGVSDEGRLTLLGNNMEGISTVKFKSTTGIFSTSFINPTSNAVVIPFFDRTVSNGVVTVSGGFGEFATSLNFIVPMPTVTGINPQTGFSGNGFLTLTGQNLYFVDYVRFVGLGFSGIYNAQPIPQTNTTLVITDHPNIISGEISLVGTNFGVIKTGIQYTDVVLPPTITGIYPTIGVDENGDVSLLGQNLTSLQTIHFASSPNGSVSTNNFFLEGFAKVRVPASAITGEISITGIGLGLTATKVQFVKKVSSGIKPVFGSYNTYFNIYPNPSQNGSFTIEFINGNEEAILEIFNAQGNNVYSQKVNSGTNLINSQLPKGLYVLRIGSSRKKLIVE